MATTPIYTNVKFPVSPFVDPSTGRPAREWVIWLQNPDLFGINLKIPLPVTSGGTGTDQIPANGQMLIGNGTGYSVNNLTPGQNIGIANGSGTVGIGITGEIPVVNGGTGADNATDARLNLSAAKSGDNSDITSLSGITGSISTVDSITFDQTAGVAATPGVIAWNSGDGCLDIGMGYDSVVLQTGLESLYRIKASATITNGQLIQFDGAVGASGVIKGKPSVTGLTEGLYIMGVATMDIANNDFGYVTNFGLVRGINTTGASVGETWADGDILYYNPSYVGGMTNARPVSPAEVVVVAAVVNAGPGGSGSLFVRPSFYPKLTELSDVYARTPANGYTIIWNNSTARWEGATLTAGTGVSITNGAGSITINASAATTTTPVTYTANFSVASSDVWIINNKSGSSCTATLPSAASYSGRILHFQNYQAQTLISASSNVIPISGGAAGTAILAAVAGENCTLVSNGTNWVTTQYSSNNNLLIE